MAAFSGCGRLARRWTASSLAGALASAMAGTVLVSAVSAASVGVGPLSITLVPAAAAATAPSAVRLAGADRYGTAAVGASATYPGGAPVAYVATGIDFPDPF